MDLQIALNKIIAQSLWEPSGDPSYLQLESARDAYLLLKENNLGIQSDQEVLDCLKGNNVYEKDFMPSSTN